MAYRQIKFPVNYYKVCGQDEAELLGVRDMVVNKAKDQTYIRYEVRSEETMDGERDGRYAQLIFLGNKGIPFSHLVDSKMLDFYKGLVGLVFNIVTPSDSRKEWRKQKYGK